MTNKINLKVIGGNVLIRKIHQQKFGNLLLPENSAENFLKGTICGLGTGKKNAKGEIVNFSVEIGDEVMFPKYKGVEVPLEEAVYVVLNEDDLIAVITK